MANTYTWIKCSYERPDKVGVLLWNPHTTAGGIKETTRFKYVGFAFNMPTETASDSYTDYTWMPLMDTSIGLYTWIMYADDANGTNMSEFSENKKYIGYSYNNENAIPTMDPEDYIWNPITVSDGKSPYIDSTTGRWMEYDSIKLLYIDTSVYAKGADASVAIKNDYWYINGKNTKVKASGNNGVSPTIGENGNWYIGSTDTKVLAKGKDGKDATEWSIGDNGNWFKGSTDTGKTSKGDNCKAPYINDSGYWVLWNMDTNSYVLSKLKALGDRGPMGPAGASGKAYILDLNNEMASVACDSSGNVISKRYPSCKATLTYETETVEGAVYTCETNGCTATINSTTGDLSITGVEEDNSEITVYAAVDGEIVTSAVMSIVKIYPGADGTPATIYELTPTYSAIKVNASKKRTPSSLACDVMKIVGDSSVTFLNNKGTAVLPDNYYMQYTRDGGAVHQPYTLDSSLPALAYDKAEKNFTFYLYKDDGVLVDKETVPVLFDGSDGSSVEVDESYHVTNTSTAPSADDDDWLSLDTAKMYWGESYPYLWNKEISTSVRQGVEQTRTNVHIMAIWSKGVKDFLEEYLITDNVAKPEVKDFSSTNTDAYYSKELTDDFLKKIDGGYRWLWDKETILYTDDSSTHTIHLLSVQGQTGDSGSGYILDLTNEMASVACDSSGNVVSKFPSCTASLKYGVDKVTDATFSCKTVDCSAIIDSKSGKITIKSIDASTAEIHVDAYTIPEGKDEIEDVGTGIMSIVKVFPGADGQPATLYELMPLYNNIKVSKSGVRTPLELKCQVAKFLGESVTLLNNDGTYILPENYYMKYEKDADGELKDYVLNSSVTDTSLAEISITFYLYNDKNVLIDKENVPVLIDGTDGVGLRGEESYGVTKSGDNPPDEDDSTHDDSGWISMDAAKVAWTQDFPYLWNREKLTNSDGTETVTTHIMAIWSKGVTDFAEEYLITTSITKPDSDDFSEAVSGKYYGTELDDSFLEQIDGVYRFLWDKEITYYTNDTSSCEIHLLAVQGLSGDGGSGYTLDLDNEMASVACDSSGNVTGDFPSCNATLRYNADTVDDEENNVRYSCEPKNCTATIDLTSGKLSITGMSKDSAEINVIATFKRDENAENDSLINAIMSLVKVYPGTTIYELAPEVTAIKIIDPDKHTSVPTQFKCNVNKVYGTNITNLTELPSDYYMKVEVDGNNVKKDYTMGEDALTTSGIGFPSYSVTFYLYRKGDTKDILCDKETLPCISDGLNGDSIKLLPINEDAIAYLDESLQVNLKYRVQKNNAGTVTNLGNGYYISITDSDNKHAEVSTALLNSSVSYTNSKWVENYHSVQNDKPTSLTVKLHKKNDAETVFDTRNITVTYATGAMFTVDACLGEIKGVAQDAAGNSTLALQTANKIVHRVNAAEKTNLLSYGNLDSSALSGTTWDSSYLNSVGIWNVSDENTTTLLKSLGKCAVIKASEYNGKTTSATSTAKPYGIYEPTNTLLDNDNIYTLQYVVYLSNSGDDVLNNHNVYADIEGQTFVSGYIEKLDNSLTYYDQDADSSTLFTDNMAINIPDTNYYRVIALFKATDVTSNAKPNVMVGAWATKGEMLVSNLMLSTGTEVPVFVNARQDTYSYIEQKADSITQSVTKTLDGKYVTNSSLQLTAESIKLAVNSSLANYVTHAGLAVETEKINSSVSKIEGDYVTSTLFTETANEIKAEVHSMNKVNLIDCGNFDVEDNKWETTKWHTNSYYPDPAIANILEWSTETLYTSTKKAVLLDCSNNTAKTADNKLTGIFKETNSSLVTDQIYTLQYLIVPAENNVYKKWPDNRYVYSTLENATFVDGYIEKTLSNNLPYYDMTYDTSIAISSPTFSIPLNNWYRVVLHFKYTNNDGLGDGNVVIYSYATEGVWYIANVMLSSGTAVPVFSTNSNDMSSYIDQKADSITLAVKNSISSDYVTQSQLSVESDKITAAVNASINGKYVTNSSLLLKANEITAAVNASINGKYVTNSLLTTTASGITAKVKAFGKANLIENGNFILDSSYWDTVEMDKITIDTPSGWSIFADSLGHICNITSENRTNNTNNGNEVASGYEYGISCKTTSSRGIYLLEGLTYLLLFYACFSGASENKLEVLFGGSNAAPSLQYTYIRSVSNVNKPYTDTTYSNLTNIEVTGDLTIDITLPDNNWYLILLTSDINNTAITPIKITSCAKSGTLYVSGIMLSMVTDNNAAITDVDTIPVFTNSITDTLTYINQTADSIKFGVNSSLANYVTSATLTTTANSIKSEVKASTNTINLLRHGNFKVSSLTDTSWYANNIYAYDTDKICLSDMTSWGLTYQESVGTSAEIRFKYYNDITLVTGIYEAPKTKLCENQTYTLQFTVALGNYNDGTSDSNLDSKVLYVNMEGDLTFVSGYWQDLGNYQNLPYANIPYDDIPKNSITNNLSFEVNTTNWARVVLLFTIKNPLVSGKVPNIVFYFAAKAGRAYISNIMLSAGTDVPIYRDSVKDAYSYIDQKANSITLAVSSKASAADLANYVPTTSLSAYYTKTEADAKFTITDSAIEAVVNGKYISKTEAGEEITTLLSNKGLSVDDTVTYLSNGTAAFVANNNNSYSTTLSLSHQYDSGSTLYKGLGYIGNGAISWDLSGNLIIKGNVDFLGMTSTYGNDSDFVLCTGIYNYSDTPFTNSSKTNYTMLRGFGNIYGNGNSNYIIDTIINTGKSYSGYYADPTNIQTAINNYFTVANIPTGWLPYSDKTSDTTYGNYSSASGVSDMETSDYKASPVFLLPDPKDYYGRTITRDINVLSRTATEAFYNCIVFPYKTRIDTKLTSIFRDNIIVDTRLIPNIDFASDVDESKRIVSVKSTSASSDVSDSLCILNSNSATGYWNYSQLKTLFKYTDYNLTDNNYTSEPVRLVMTPYAIVKSLSGYNCHIKLTAKKYQLGLGIKNDYYAADDSNNRLISYYYWEIETDDFMLVQGDFIYDAQDYIATNAKVYNVIPDNSYFTTLIENCYTYPISSYMRNNDIKQYLDEYSIADADRDIYIQFDENETYFLNNMLDTGNKYIAGYTHVDIAEYLLKKYNGTGLANAINTCDLNTISAMNIIAKNSFSGSLKWDGTTANLPSISDSTKIGAVWTSTSADYGGYLQYMGDYWVLYTSKSDSLRLQEYGIIEVTKF